MLNSPLKHNEQLYLTWKRNKQMKSYIIVESNLIY